MLFCYPETGCKPGQLLCAMVFGHRHPAAGHWHYVLTCQGQRDVRIPPDIYKIAQSMLHCQYQQLYGRGHGIAQQVHYVYVPHVSCSM